MIQYIKKDKPVVKDSIHTDKDKLKWDGIWDKTFEQSQDVLETLADEVEK